MAESSRFGGGAASLYDRECRWYAGLPTPTLVGWLSVADPQPAAVRAAATDRWDAALAARFADDHPELTTVTALIDALDVALPARPGRVKGTPAPMDAQAAYEAYLQTLQAEEDRRRGEAWEAAHPASAPAVVPVGQLPDGAMFDDASGPDGPDGPSMVRVSDAFGGIVGLAAGEVWVMDSSGALYGTSAEWQVRPAQFPAGEPFLARLRAAADADLPRFLAGPYAVADAVIEGDLSTSRAVEYAAATALAEELAGETDGLPTGVEKAAQARAAAVERVARWIHHADGNNATPEETVADLAATLTMLGAPLTDAERAVITDKLVRTGWCCACGDTLTWTGGVWGHTNTVAGPDTTGGHDPEPRQDDEDRVQAA